MAGWGDEPQATPVQPPVAPISPVSENNTQDLGNSTAPMKTTGEFKGLPVRAEGDRVYLLKEGKKFWITSPEAMAKLGFKLGDEVKIDQTTLNVLTEGEPIR